jgi:hypothetical protein
MLCLCIINGKNIFLDLRVGREKVIAEQKFCHFKQQITSVCDLCEGEVRATLEILHVSLAFLSVGLDACSQLCPISCFVGHFSLHFP